MAKRRRRKFKAFEIFGFVAGFFGFVVPGFAFIPYALFVRGFIPSDRLLIVSTYASPAMGAALLVALAPQFLSQIKREHKSGAIVAQLQTAFVVLFTPLFGFILFHSFLTETLPYALHHVASPRHMIIAEPVITSSYGGRYCRDPAHLKGDRFLVHRRVCGLSPEANRSLLRGGVIELQGSGSSYGFKIERYRVISANG